MIDTNNIEIARKQIKSEKKPIIIKAKDNIFNRKILEYGKFDILLSPEAGQRKDGLKQMDSGLNSILARIAAKNNISIGIDINEISGLNKKDKALRLARIKQNIAICKKTKTKLIALNYKDQKDIFNLLLTLGASTSQAKEAISRQF